MPGKREALRDWHRLFGLLLTDFFTRSPFIVEVERDLSVQQQLLDVVIVRRGRGRFVGRLPDGLDGLREHNLITFKSHREALDAWAMKELIGHSVAYRKLVSPSPSALLPEGQFGLYAICARFPQQLSGQVPWQPVQPGVYDCSWGTDAIRVLVAGELPPEPHNALLHLFSAAPELVEFGRGAYRRHSETTSLLLGQLFKKIREEGLAMYTMEDFVHDYVKEHFPRLTLQEQREALERLSPQHLREVLSPKHLRQVLHSLPPEVRLAGLSEAQVRQLLDQMAAGRASHPRKPRPKRSPDRRSPDAPGGKNPKKRKP
jgi:hypothetical protein